MQPRRPFGGINGCRTRIDFLLRTMSLRTHRAGGLPSNPRSRSPQPPQGRDNYSGYNDPPDDLFSSGRGTARTQQGLPGSVRPDRSARRQQQQQDDYARPASDSGARGDGRYGARDDRYAQQSSSRPYEQAGYDDRPTSTSTSSSASSLLDRMKQRGNLSSARTSIDDDPPQTAKANTSLRTRSRLQQQQREPSPDYERTFPCVLSTSADLTQ